MSASTAAVVPRLTAWAMIALGVTLFATYLLYLPKPDLFQFGSAVGNGLGLIFYSLATAGSAFIAWGIMLNNMQGDGLNRQQVLRASAIGVALLGIMRLFTAIFPPVPFDSMLALPLVEFVVFTALAVKLFRS